MGSSATSTFTHLTSFCGEMMRDILCGDANPYDKPQIIGYVAIPKFAFFFFKHYICTFPRKMERDMVSNRLCILGGWSSPIFWGESLTPWSCAEIDACWFTKPSSWGNDFREKTGGFCLHTWTCAKRTVPREHTFFFNAETMSAVVALRRESPIINFALQFQRAITFLLELNSKPAKQIIWEIWGVCRWGTCLEAVHQLRMPLHGTAPPMTDGFNHRTQEKTWRKQ